MPRPTHTRSHGSAATPTACSRSTGASTDGPAPIAARTRGVLRRPERARGLLVGWAQRLRHRLGARCGADLRPRAGDRGGPGWCRSASGSDGLCEQAGGLGAHRIAIAPDGSAVFVLADGPAAFAAGATLTSSLAHRTRARYTPVTCIAAGAAVGSRCASPPGMSGGRDHRQRRRPQPLPRVVRAGPGDADAAGTEIDTFAMDGAACGSAGCLVPASAPLRGARRRRTCWRRAPSPPTMGWSSSRAVRG